MNLRDKFSDEHFKVLVECLGHAHDGSLRGVARENHLLHIAEVVQVVKNNALQPWLIKVLTHSSAFKVSKI